MSYGFNDIISLRYQLNSSFWLFESEKMTVLNDIKCLSCTQRRYKRSIMHKYIRWFQQRLIALHYMVQASKCPHRWVGIPRHSTRSNCWFENILCAWLVFGLKRIYIWYLVMFCFIWQVREATVMLATQGWWQIHEEKRGRLESFTVLLGPDRIETFGIS